MVPKLARPNFNFQKRKPFELYLRNFGTIVKEKGNPMIQNRDNGYSNKGDQEMLDMG